MTAIKNNDIGIVEVLLEKGADPNIGSDTVSLLSVVYCIMSYSTCSI